MKKSYLFVTGCSRSGTTAITLLLNQHPSIVLGIERYKYYVNKKNIEELTPAFFDKHRFFDFRKSDTDLLPNSTSWEHNVAYPENVIEISTLFKKHRFFNFDKDKTNIIPNSNIWENFYKQIYNKYSQAAFIGDKLPAYYNFYDEMTKAFYVPKWIFMLRNVEDVAMSYNMLVQNAENVWPPEGDYRRAVEHWNKSLEKTLQYADKKFNNIFCCEYEIFFSYNLRYLQRLLDFLEIDFNPEVQNAYRLITKEWDQRVKNKNTINKSVSDYVKSQANLVLANKLVTKLMND